MQEGRALLGPIRSRQRELRERPEVRAVLDADGLAGKDGGQPLTAEQRSWLPLEKAFREVVVEVIPDAGHYSWIDEPDAFDRALLEAVSRGRAKRQPAGPSSNLA